MDAADTDAVLGASGGVDDHMVTCLASDSGRIKEIDLLSGAELDVHHLNCLVLLFH